MSTPKILCVIDFSIRRPFSWINGTQSFFRIKEIWKDDVKAIIPSFNQNRFYKKKNHFSVHWLENPLETTEDRFCEIYNQDVFKNKINTLSCYWPENQVNEAIRQLKLNPKQVEVVIYFGELCSFNQNFFSTFSNARSIFASFGNEMKLVLPRWTEELLKNHHLEKVDLMDAREVPLLLEKMHLESILPSSIQLPERSPRL